MFAKKNNETKSEYIREYICLVLDYSPFLSDNFPWLFFFEAENEAEKTTWNNFRNREIQ